MNYRRRDLDGNTAFVTRAADLAAATGILVVVSAGNEGNDAWRTVTPPRGWRLGAGRRRGRRQGRPGGF
jgi:subtilisin family serine protease